MTCSERETVRDLAKRYMEIARDPAQEAKREIWRRHHSLRGDVPLIYTRKFAFYELSEAQLVCSDPALKRVEYHFRRQLYWAGLADDAVFEPWYTIRPVFASAGWGVDVPREYSEEDRGSFKIDYPIREPEDIRKLTVPEHRIDEVETERLADFHEELLGDIITIDLDRSPCYRDFGGDLSTQLGHLRGIEFFMMDMIDDPDWLKELVFFLASGVEKAHREGERQEDWGYTSHSNQAQAYCEELPDPAPNARTGTRKELWGFMAAQEFTGVSPEMHEEFLLSFQRPILENFGLSAYGCCEDLSRKIDLLRSVSNLRRIAVSPMADVRRCAEQIGPDYILSYRPSPTDMVGYDFDEERIRRITREALAACRANGCHVDITLKDTETVQGDPERVRQWVRISREVIDSVWG